MTTLITQYTGAEDDIRLIHGGLISRVKELGKIDIYIEKGLDESLTIIENDIKRKTVLKVGDWFMLMANQYMTMNDEDYQKMYFL